VILLCLISTFLMIVHARMFEAILFFRVSLKGKFSCTLIKRVIA
jgi:hypothetical protein